ncbi:hypothetical protein LuPra_03771 [Luteitalea pratensis]|uniref:DUF3592 domain-containing protein n=1 Tax=Luteitalea pratensis TaxID=1855912 RepID=A0A143PPN6_LUTPR|nr:hypothetical protein LuPra_03771 [Luteitalea pratensis]
MLGTVLVLVSLGLLVAGWRLTENDRYFLLHAARATGQVVAHEAFEREAWKVTKRFRMVVSFSTPSGSRIRFRSVSNYGKPPYAVGDTVGVRYDPERPTRARVDRRIELLAPLLIWTGAVMLLAVLGVVIAIYGPTHARAMSRVRGAPSPSGR